MSYLHPPPSLRVTKQSVSQFSRMFPALCLVCAGLMFCACGGKKKDADRDNSGAVVVTSSWTAAYAQAAGAENVVVLAPFEMAHPSEYELRPSDIPILKEATVIVYAGYEVMTERLTKGLDLPSEKLFLVTTEYNFATIEKSVIGLAVKLGTESVARQNLLEIQNAFDDGRKALGERKWTGQKVVVSRFLVPLARELGLVPVMIFGPGAPEVADIVAVAKSDAVIIMDNSHNPVGQPFKEVLPHALYVQLLNFPGQYETKTLPDVIRYNISQLLITHH